jgi:hypothetical protein
MSSKKYRFGFVVAVTAMVTLACTCGGLGGLSQAQGQVQTLQAAATAVATSGVISTAEALATGVATSDAGGSTGGANLGVPDNIPVMDGASNVVAAGGAVSYSVKSDLAAVEDFYKKGMVDKGWKEDQPAVEVAGVTAALTYANDTQKAAVALTASGGEVQVAIAVTNK